jgi:hypothetical protein
LVEVFRSGGYAGTERGAVLYVIAKSPPITPRTDPIPVMKLPPAKRPTTENTTMIVPHVGY